MTEVIEPSEQFKSGLEIIINAFESQKTELNRELEIANTQLKEKNDKILELENTIQKLISEKISYESRIKELEDKNKSFKRENSFRNNNVSIFGSKSTKNKDILRDIGSYDIAGLDRQLNYNYMTNTEDKFKSIPNNPSSIRYYSDVNYTPSNDSNTGRKLNTSQYTKERSTRTLDPQKKIRNKSMRTSRSMNEMKDNFNSCEILENSEIKGKPLGPTFFSKCKTLMDPYYYNKMLQVVKNFNHNQANKKDTYNEIIQILRDASCMDLLDDLNQLFL